MCACVYCGFDIVNIAPAIVAGGTFHPVCVDIMYAEMYDESCEADTNDDDMGEDDIYDDTFEDSYDDYAECFEYDADDGRYDE